MNFIKLTAAFIYFLLLSSIECTKKDYLENIPKEVQAKGLLKMFLKLQAFNIRKKYELGKKLCRIINRMDFSDRRPFKLMKEKPSEDYDKDPEQSFVIAGNLFNDYKKAGWDGIDKKIGLTLAKDRQKLLLIAINNQDLALVRKLVDEKHALIKHQVFNYAFRKYREKGGPIDIENIIDFMVSKNPEELGSIPDLKNKLKTDSDVHEICEAVRLNHYPKLRKALDNGLNPNLQCDHTGSILAMAVVSKCARCVEMLVQKGANVNDYITLNNSILYDGDMSKNPFNWTLLMSAVADANERIIITLLRAGALVSKTAKGQENERFHARAVARMITIEALREKALSILIPSKQEFERLKKTIEGHNFWDSFKDKSKFHIADNFLLLRPVLDKIGPKQEGNYDNEQILTLSGEFLY